MYRRLVNELSLFRRHTLAEPRRLRESTLEHQKILALIAAGEPRAPARALLRARDGEPGAHAHFDARVGAGEVRRAIANAQDRAKHNESACRAAPPERVSTMQYDAAVSHRRGTDRPTIHERRHS